MKAYDFQFGEHRLSDFGMIICNFGSKGLETISDGSQITFNTVTTLSGNIHKLVSTQYDSCLEATIQIAKYSCDTGIEEITAIEHRNITKWLLKKRFLKFKFLDKDNIDLYHEASIASISRIEINGKLYGLELVIKTNRPFALQEPKTIIINNKYVNGNHIINDTSHEEGYIYPFAEIVVNQNGDLTIHNAIENRDTIIKNCIAGEIITMDYPVITSSISSHRIQNDFNWNFFRIANTFDNSRNDIKVSIPCSIKIKYSPVVKVGL